MELKSSISSVFLHAGKHLKPSTDIMPHTLPLLLTGNNITETNRGHVDRRLNELTTQKQQIEVRLEELERLSLSQAEIDTIVNESMQFLAGLEFTLHNSLPQEKLTTLRQCIEKIKINKSSGEISLVIRKVPVGNLLDTQEIKTFV